MQIGIISDVHDNLRHLNKAINFFNEKKIDLLVHCGDWDMPFTMRSYTQLQCPIRGVLGNGDPDIQKFLYQLQNLEALKNLDLKLEFRFCDFTIDNVRFGVFHGDDENLNKCLIESRLFDVLCLGHTHKPSIEKNGKTLVINPGSLVGYTFETGNIPITVALFDTDSKEARLVGLEKGES
jgi:putative phosphoesterase